METPARCTKNVSVVADLPILLRQIPDIVLEIASHLPTESAMCLALTCKSLYGLLSQNTFRKMRRDDRKLDNFLFLLLKDMSGRGVYLCHHCSQIRQWICPTGTGCLECPSIGTGQLIWSTPHGRLNEKIHRCIGASAYFTFTVNGIEHKNDNSRWVMHRDRGGWRLCCSKGFSPTTLT
ncbi:hypothetical protein CORC01_01818 [Colletotrichum orchidophilum]|uniref:F-box domain-containing protein n=1 Tax=Colletotrichum orchidophilum TaxID=1209926 RepID=A0A1G4BNN2_9PEZI|nr:uncharacterized protein CORC01_01818 [Colletotrichum orchidophilum]OHF03060.1 hypothetical protein CORC01_01818 [Colletotrichum orchidophilum]